MPQPVRLKAVVDKVVCHAADLRTLLLAPERPAPRFRPGQFLHLAIDPYDPSSHWPESRIFSIASSPAKRDKLAVTFSVVGRFTKRMLELEAGSEVWLKLPYGEFLVETSPAAPAVLVAGGTGVTPFASLLTDASTPAGPIALLYGARSPELLIFREPIERAAAGSSLLQASLFVESGAAVGARTGRLSVDDALAAAAKLGASETAVFYISGPPAMLRYFQDSLAARGVAAGRIRIDAWGEA
jgi:ferredoxin-NADP reductase